MRKLRLALAWAVLSLLIAAATVWAPRPVLADSSCFVLALSGNVTFEHNGAKSNLARGDALAPGDRIATASGARVKLRFADGSEVNLGEKSEIKIDTIDVDVNAGTRSILLDLPMGVLRAAAAKLLHTAGSRFEIHTGIAYSAVRGTHWIVVAQPNETRVYVQEGHVAVGPDFPSEQFSKLVDGGRWVRVTRQLGVGPLEATPPATLDNLINQTASAVAPDGTEFAENVPSDGTVDSGADGNVVGSTVGTIGSAAGNTVGALTGTVGNTVGALAGTVSNTVGALTGAVGGLTGDTVATTASTLSATTTTVSSVTGTVTSVTGQVVSNLTGALGLSGGSNSGGSSGGSSSGGSSAGGSSSSGSSAGGSSAGETGSSSGSSASSGSESSSGGSSSSSGTGSSGLGGAARSLTGAVKSALGGLLH